MFGVFVSNKQFHELRQRVFKLEKQRTYGAIADVLCRLIDGEKFEEGHWFYSAYTERVAQREDDNILVKKINETARSCVKNDIKGAVEGYINNEYFIDAIVDRINRKQVGK